MDKEHNLTHYRVYNKENCQRECVAIFILKKCECALLSAPSKIISIFNLSGPLQFAVDIKTDSEGQKICIDNDFRCVRDAEGSWFIDIYGNVFVCMTNCVVEGAFVILV